MCETVANRKYQGLRSLQLTLRRLGLGQVPKSLANQANPKPACVPLPDVDKFEGHGEAQINFDSLNFDKLDSLVCSVWLFQFFFHFG